MSGTNLSTAGDALQRRLDSPVEDPSADASLDTALPPMSSKQLVVSTRRPRASESSLIASNLRGTHGRAVAALHYPPDTTATIARAPSSSHRRTGSTLKTVMRKIFTRKGRGDDEYAHSRSDNTSPRSDKSLDKPLPLSNSLNAKPSRPLQLDAGPTSWEEALQKLEPHPRRRRATLPSLIFSDEESRVALEAVVNSTRPISKRDNSPHANSDPDDVRRREMRRIKRRSRSATALRGKDHLMSPIQWRRRSLESCAASTAFGAPSEVDINERPPTRTTVASAPKPNTGPSFLEDEEDEAQDEVLAQNVSTLVNSMQHDENVTLEQRLTTLEVKMIDLEFAIARMQSGRETPAEPKKSSPTTTRHKRKQSSAPSGPNDLRAKSPDADRPDSTTTLRPSPLHRSRTLQAPSSTSLHECNSISVEQYSALVMLLRREQTARRELEQQVSGLRDDIQQLHQMARESMGLGSPVRLNSPIVKTPNGFNAPNGVNTPPSTGTRTMYPIRSMDSQDIRRLRQALGPSPTATEHSRPDKPYDSDSEERPELPPKDGYQPRWPASRRVEVSGMI